MNAAANLTDLPREMATALVEHEQRRTGSRMEAYETVSRTVGTSAQWLRYFVGGSAKVKEPGWSVGWRIVTAFDRLCSRQVAEAELDMQRLRALRGQIDAGAVGDSTTSLLDTALDAAIEATRPRKADAAARRPATGVSET